MAPSIEKTHPATRLESVKQDNRVRLYALGEQDYAVYRNGARLDRVFKGQAGWHVYTEIGQAWPTRKQAVAVVTAKAGAPAR